MKIRFLTLMWMLMLFSVCYAFGWTSKEWSQNNTFSNYVVKSDIINFDYSKMAYPASDGRVGIKDSITAKVPAKRVEPRPLTDEEKFEKTKEEILDGLAMCGLFFLLLISCICWTVYIPRFLVWLFLLIRRKIIRMWHGEGLFRSKSDDF